MFGWLKRVFGTRRTPIPSSVITPRVEQVSHPQLEELLPEPSRSTTATVRAAVVASFPASDQASVLAELESLNSHWYLGCWTEDLERVQLAIVGLSNGSVAWVVERSYRESDWRDSRV